jgi:hypothetical protein
MCKSRWGRSRDVGGGFPFKAHRKKRLLSALETLNSDRSVSLLGRSWARCKGKARHMKDQACIKKGKWVGAVLFTRSNRLLLRPRLTLRPFTKQSYSLFFVSKMVSVMQQTKLSSSCATREYGGHERLTRPAAVLAGVT